MYRPPVTCNRCQTPVTESSQEFCWYCDGPLCSACWELLGHCGHQEAEAENERQRVWSREHATTHAQRGCLCYLCVEARGTGAPPLEARVGG